MAACTTPPVKAPAASEAPRELTAAERAALAHAEEVRISKCMAKRGLTYAVVEPRTAASGSRDGLMAAMYGNDDLDLAAEDVAAPSQSGADADPNGESLRRMTERDRQDYEVAMFGTVADRAAVTLPDGRTLTTSTKGCVAEARRELYGDVLVWAKVEFIVANLDSLAYAKVVAEPRYASALARWAECMRVNGYSYASPAEVEAAEQPAGDAAVADARCNKESGLAATARELHLAHRREIENEKHAEIMTYIDLSWYALQKG